MADLQTLFHNPEAFSDSDLALVKQRIRMQRYTPWLTAAAAGGSMYVLDMAIFKRKVYNPYMLGVATVLGFAIGGAAAHSIKPKNTHLYSTDV